MSLEQRINKMIPVDGVRAFVSPVEYREGQTIVTSGSIPNVDIIWQFDNLGIELKTKLKTDNLSNEGIKRLLKEIVLAAKQVMVEAKD